MRTLEMSPYGHAVYRENHELGGLDKACQGRPFWVALLVEVIEIQRCEDSSLGSSPGHNEPSMIRISG